MLLRSPWTIALIFLDANYIFLQVKKYGLL